VFEEVDEASLRLSSSDGESLSFGCFSFSASFSAFSFGNFNLTRV
jgi:hypothetical protein